MRMKGFPPINPILRMTLYMDLPYLSRFKMILYMVLQYLRGVIVIHYMDLPFLRGVIMILDLQLGSSLRSQVRSKVSGVIINKFFIKGNLWSRRRYTIDNTCHVFEWPARPVENEIQAVPPRTRARTTEELIASNAAVVASHGRVLESNAAVVESNNRLTAAIYQLISRLGESSTNRP
uniref:Uncharacterized protein n=1 Tax=Triticum urartu TaxID=4572 RepID=A0A8R7QZU0_TRIUA